MTIVYFIFILLAIYYSYKYDGIEVYDSHKQHRLWLMCIYLICLTGFSYGLGADKFSYMLLFEDCPEDFSELGEYMWLQFMKGAQTPFWVIVNLFCKSVFHSFYAVQLLESAAINTAVCYLISKNTHRYFLFLIVYFVTLQYFIFNTEIMREGFALSFVLVGMDAYSRGKKWLFYVMLPFGLMFHLSAAIAILFPFTRFKLSWYTLPIAIAISFCIWLFSDKLLSAVMAAVFGGQGALTKKIMFYSIMASSIFGFIRALATYLVFPYIIMYTLLSAEPSEERRYRMTRWTSFMLVLAIMACAFTGFARFYNYVQIFYLIMLTEFIYNLIRTREHLIVRMGTFAGTLFLVILSYFSHYDLTDTYFYDFFYPYTCILNETDDVYIREIAHYDATTVEIDDNNVRDVD